MNLAILLTTGPQERDVQTVSGLAEAALGRGWEVNMFLMGEGVRSLSALARLADPARNGDGAGGPPTAAGGSLSITVCAHNAEQRGVEPVAGVRWGSQADWAAMVAAAERVLAFG